MDEKQALDEMDPATMDDTSIMDKDADVDYTPSMDEQDPVGADETSALDERDLVGVDETSALDEQDPVGVDETSAVDEQDLANVEEDGQDTADGDESPTNFAPNSTPKVCFALG